VNEECVKMRKSDVGLR